MRRVPGKDADVFAVSQTSLANFFNRFEKLRLIPPGRNVAQQGEGEIIGSDEQGIHPFDRSDVVDVLHSFRCFDLNGRK